MKCLQCGVEIPEAFFTQRNQSESIKGGRFACPQCGAEHVRRVIGQDPSGAPLFSVRLWGHLKAAKRKPVAVQAAERRQTPRAKRWR